MDQFGDEGSPDKNAPHAIVDLAGSEEIQSVHLAEALHASQSSEDHAGVIKPG